MKVFNLTQKINNRLAELIQKLTQININNGARCIFNAMKKILQNLKIYKDGTIMVSTSIHVALMPYVQD